MMFKQKLYLCLLLIFSISAANASDKLIGSWTGAVFVDDAPIGMDLKISQVKTNINGGVLHYGEPRGCRLNIAYIAESNHSYWFTMKESTGGFCDKLAGQRIIFKLSDGDSSLDFEISSKKPNVPNESGSLSKQ